MYKYLAAHLHRGTVPLLLKLQPQLLSLKVNLTTKKKSYYEILGVRPTATQEEIKSAFYKLSLQHHPDKDSTTGAKDRFQQISTAYEVLGNHASRKQYDMRMRVTETVDRKTRKQHFTSQHINEIYTPKDKIYNFDEWTRQHYQQTFYETMERKREYQYNQKYDYKPVDNSYSQLVTAAVVTTVGSLIILYIRYNEEKFDIPRKKPDADS